jgi:hypothetical protein
MAQFEIDAVRLAPYFSEVVTRRSRISIGRFLLASVVVLCAAATVISQPTAGARIYRGSVGGSHFQMRLNIQGNTVSGAYSYDTIGEDLKLTGHLDSQGRLELAESSARGKPTGKFVCKRFNDAAEPDCTWSRPDGAREAYVTLAEQHFGFTNGLQVIPKTIANRKSGVSVSYPQISNGTGALSPGAASFNRLVLALTQKAIKEFEPGDEPGRNSFETNYNVLLATDDLISIEMTEYSDSGGAHPNNGFWSLTYDLSGDKALGLDDLFKPGSDYKTAIANFVVADIERRAIAFEQEDARTEGRKPTPREGPIVTIDQLSEVSDWGLTPKGLVVYFDFPHAIAAFDRTLIPYSVVDEYLKPNGPASRIHKL